MSTIEIKKPKKSAYGPAVVGKTKVMTVKEMRKALKAGKTVRNVRGFYFSEQFLASKIDQDKQHNVFVK